MRILLVEDEARLAASLADGLRRERHAVDVAADGAEGLWYAEEHAYDVIVLDVMLPRVDGYEVCRRLRARDDWTPVLLLTARDGDDDHVTGLDAGADDYVTKPFSFEVLLARLRSLARRRPAERPAVLEVGDLALDPATHAVTRAGDPVEVTAREFAVLEVLMRRAGTVVPKARLIDAVWGFDFDGDPNIVEVYVARLRRRLGPSTGPGSAAIATVRGTGYRVEVA